MSVSFLALSNGASHLANAPRDRNRGKTGFVRSSRHDIGARVYFEARFGLARGHGRGEAPLHGCSIQLPRLSPWRR
jgi:hypothetical protein